MVRDVTIADRTLRRRKMRKKEWRKGEYKFKLRNGKELLLKGCLPTSEASSIEVRARALLKPP